MKYLAFILLFVSCNPVKQVLKDNNKFEQVKEAVIRSGACVNDTVRVSIVKDSIVYNDSIIEVIKEIPCQDFDTVIGKARIKISSGVLIYSAKDSVIYRTKTITNTVRDNSLEGILNNDIVKKNAEILTYIKLLKESKDENKVLSKGSNEWKFRFWLGVIAILISLFHRQIIKIIIGLI